MVIHNTLLVVIFLLSKCDTYGRFAEQLTTKMKKQILSFIAFAAGITAAYAQCGTADTKVWDGGGSNVSFFTPENWVGDVAPDCNDNVVFGGSGNKRCEIPSSFITTGDITVNSNYGGSIIVRGRGTNFNANDLVLSRGTFTFQSGVGNASFNRVTVGEQCMLAFGGNDSVNIRGLMTLNVAGYVGFKGGSVAVLNSITQHGFSQIKLPEDGIARIRGDIEKARMSTFDARFTTVQITGSAEQLFHLSTGTGTNGTRGTLTLRDLILNKTNSSDPTRDNFYGLDGTDTIIVLNKLTLLDGDFNSGGHVKILDTLNFVGVGAQGHTANFIMAGTKQTDVICNDGTATPSGNWTLTIDLHNSNDTTKIWKGKASSINLGSGAVNVVRGRFFSSDDVDMTINKNITVASNGQLIAPAGKRLTLGGSWNMANRNAFRANNGEVYINGATNNGWNHNNNRITFNKLTLAATGTQSWSTSANDTLWVLGELKLAGAAVSACHIVFMENVTSDTNAVNPSADDFIAAGSTKQIITLAKPNQMNRLMINKPSQDVELGSDFTIERLTMKKGHILVNGKKFTINASNGIIGGLASSYIKGAVHLVTTSSLGGSRMIFPVGSSTKYRPFILHTSSGTNTWEIEFKDTDPTTLGTTLNGTLTGITTDGYWVANRTAGGGTVLSTAAYFEVADAGKGTWLNANLRVLKYDGTSAWDNLGGRYMTNSVLSTVNTERANQNFIVTLGEDNTPSQPNMFVHGETVSGNEINTAGTSKANGLNASNPIQFGVYPNPAAETLHIALSGTQKGSITLTDMSGKVLGVYTADTRSINMQSFAPGVYFATFSNGSQNITHRVIHN